jgi:D-3-phosphoglycerate dehydrogenase
LADKFHPSLKERAALLGDVTENINDIKNADVLILRSKIKCTKDFIDSAPKLKLILRAGIGVDNIDMQYAQSKGIIVKNTPKASSIAVAELAFALMIAIPTKLIGAHVSMSAGEWKKYEIDRTELYVKTLCLVGLGKIAEEVAKRAAVFGMNIVGFRKNYAPHSFVTVMRSLEDAVKDADYISIHLPFAPDTEKIFNEKIINCCLRKPAVINTGRAQCIDADALSKALHDGRISFYASDVWVTEPPESSYPLFIAENTIMTPHIGASSCENFARVADEVISILKKIIDEWKRETPKSRKSRIRGW